MPSCFEFLYLIGKSLQIAAGFLLVGNTDVTKKGIVKEYKSRYLGFTGKRRKVVKLRDVVRTSWTNRIAFYYFGIGSFVEMTGVTPEHNVYLILLAAFMSFLFWFIAFNSAKKRAQEF